MRAEYETMLDDLARSKRLALREMSDMYEAQLLEKMNIIGDVRCNKYL